MDKKSSVKKVGTKPPRQAPHDKLSVFNYTDYRQYLRDYYLTEKQKDKKFSYRTFLEKVQLHSSGFYKELLDGKRSLTRTLIMRFSKVIGHTVKESDYFENMVYFNEATTIEERKLYFDKMKTFYETSAYRLHKDQYEYFSEWYYCAIRELLACHKYKESDAASIAQDLNPTIRPEKAAKAIRILKNLGMAEENELGYLVRRNKVVTTGYPEAGDERVKLLNIINFQKSMLKIADEAYDRHPFCDIDMSTLTLSISEETYKIMKKEIANFRKKLLSLAHDSVAPNMVYQLNYNFFPLTKKK
jgi:uncharacterized protein (TIGR02147 family)